MSIPTRTDLKTWFDEGKEDKYTHMLVVYDSFSHEDYPKYVAIDENVHDKIKFVQRSPMQRLMEVYDLNMERDAQLDVERAYNIPPRPKNDPT